MPASFDRLRLRLPDPVLPPVGLVNAGFPLARGLRFFLGVGEEGGGPIYPSGSSRSLERPQRGAASPKPLLPIEDCFLPSLGKIQATDSAFLSVGFSTKDNPTVNQKQIDRGYRPTTRKTLVVPVGGLG
jgi:hypothetical protein